LEETSKKHGKHGLFSRGNVVAWRTSMNVSMYQAAAAMNAQAQWQEMIADNLAASSVPAFKRNEMTFAAVEAGYMQADGPKGSQHFQMPKASMGINFEPGEYRYTGQNLDVAIDGPGFFEVQMPNGDLAYTRDGQFQLNASGQVVTKDGYLVMGDSGPVQADTTLNDPLEFSATGEASQGRDTKGRLKVVDFNDPQLLQRAGGYFLTGAPGLEAQPLTNLTLRPQSIEAANTSPMSEMTSLITSMRLFESNSRLLQMQDQHLERTVHDLSPEG
jgi:flagellar basal body rod protein FlgG